jgi:signal transduction histidine kinase
MMTATMVLLAGIAFLVSAALVSLTTLLQRYTEEAAASVESVRLAEQAQSDLLQHQRATDPRARAELERGLRLGLEQARAFVTAPDEAVLLDAAAAKLDAYLASARSDAPAAELAARREAADEALETLTNANLAQAAEARQAATRWNQVANASGVAAALSLIVITVGVLGWLGRRAFAPLFSLAATLERFGRGERDAREREQGPAEIREMIRRFNDMAAALSVQRESQLAFLGGVAHDLKNPLSVLKMSVGSVHPDRPLPSEQQLRQVISKIDRQLDRLLRMVNDLLDMAKIEAGQLELKLEERDARTLVREVLALFEGTLPVERLQVALPAEPVVVRVDPLRMEQVITNLISNAIKYSPQDTVVDVALEPAGREVALRVTDRGLGIPREEQKRLFEPFRRQGLSKEAVPGVGLGLFVVRRILDAHGCRIEVESAPGSGSTFRVFLPLAG